MQRESGDTLCYTQLPIMLYTKLNGMQHGVDMECDQQAMVAIPTLTTLVKVLGLGKSVRMKYLYIWNVLITQHSTSQRKPGMPNISLIRLVISIKHQLVTERQQILH